MNALRKFFRLQPLERSLLLKAWCLMILVRAGLALCEFQKLRKWLARCAQPQPQLAGQKITPQRLGWIVAVAGRYWYWNKPCLTLALVLKLLLDRRGIPAKMHIGVKKDGCGKLLAHAWITHEGAIIIGNLPNLGEFKEFTPI